MKPFYSASPIISKALFFLIIILGICVAKNAYPAPSGSRCETSDCLCRVKPGGPPASSLYKETSMRSSSVFFKENDFNLSLEQKISIQSFFKKIKGTYSQISVIGYADGCGSHQYNKGLSLSRALEVKRIAQEVIPYATVKIISAGEKTSYHSASSRRVDIIAHTSRILTTKIEKIPSDFYLVDASGSMQHSYKKWRDIIAASVKPNSRVYLSKTGGCYNGQYMSSVSPGGATEIWWSYWHVLDKMRPGETLLIISDLNSRYPLTQKERVLFENKVTEKKVIVRTIYP